MAEEGSGYTNSSAADGKHAFKAPQALQIKVISTKKLKRNTHVTV